MFSEDNLKIMAHNVPAVNEGFLCPMRKMRSIFRAQKTLAEKNPTKALSADWDFSELSRLKAAYVYSPVI
jgi:hypothetical protein